MRVYLCTLYLLVSKLAVKEMKTNKYTGKRLAVGQEGFQPQKCLPAPAGRWAWLTESCSAAPGRGGSPCCHDPRCHCSRRGRLSSSPPPPVDPSGEEDGGKRESEEGLQTKTEGEKRIVNCDTQLYSLSLFTISATRFHGLPFQYLFH